MRKDSFVLIGLTLLAITSLSILGIVQAQEPDAIHVVGGTLNLEGSLIRIGQVEGFLQIDGNGTLTLHGEACVWKEAFVPATTTKKGAFAPDDVDVNIGESGNVREAVLNFKKGQNDEVFIVFHAPSDIDENIDVTFTFMWMPEPGYTSGAYAWQLEYLVKDEDGVNANYTSGASTTLTKYITPTTDDFFIETNFTSTIDLNCDQVLIGVFSRIDNVANAGGYVRFFEIEYKVDKLGLEA